MMYVAPMPMSFFLVRADSPYTSIADIANTKPKIRLLTSKKGSSPAVASENMLKQYGFSFEDIKGMGRLRELRFLRGSLLPYSGRPC